MNALLSLAVFVLALGAVGFQDDQLQITRNKSDKVESKANKSLSRDKSKPVRRALEAQYAKLSEALKNKDFEAFQALRVPEFSTRGGDGELQTAAQIADRARLLLERIQPPIESSFTIETIDLKGSDEAVATVHQRFSRMQMVAGQLRKVETSVTQDETWVNTPDGWKLKFVNNERDMMRVIDGKRVEPGKPYDPSAPPYTP